MPSNVRQLLENGTPIYPITERSLVIGLQDAPFEYYVVAWDGASTPVVAKIPAGVVVTYNNTNYTGTLAASAATAPYLYLVASTTQAGEYDRYIVTNNGNNTFTWTPVGSTAPLTPVIVDNLTTNDATKALSAKQGKVLKDELSQFEAQLTELNADLSGYKFSINGFIYNANGGTDSNSQFRRTDYIKVIGCDIKVTGVSVGPTPTAIAFYDNDKVFISAGYNNTTEAVIPSANIPANAVYFRCCTDVSAINTARIYQGNIAILADAIDKNRSLINQCGDIVSEYLKYSLKFNNVGFITDSGDINPNQNYIHTDLFPIFGYSLLSYYVAIAGSQPLVTFYDKDKKLISSLSILGSGSSSSSVDLSLPQYASVCFVALSNDIRVISSGYYANLSNETNIDFESLEQEINDKKESIRAIKVGDSTPFSLSGYINTSGGISSNNDYAHTDFLRLSRNYPLKVSGIFAGPSSLGVAFYDADKVFISGINDTTGVTIPTENFPQSAVFYRCGTRADFAQTAEIVNASLLSLTQVQGSTGYNNLLPAPGKLKVLAFGDSISFGTDIVISNDKTTSYQYRLNDYIKDGSVFYYKMWPQMVNDILQCVDLRCYAFPGAEYKYATRTAGNELQNLKYQIDVAFNDLDNPNSVFPTTGSFVPDIIIFALGTNDGAPNDTYDSAMAKTVMSPGGKSFDVEATLANLDLTKFNEAVRYAFLRVKARFPHAIFLCSLPIQRASGNETNLTTLHDALKKMAERYSITVIDGAFTLGVIQDLETISGQGANLKDGLHPNEYGQNMMARMFINAIKNNYVDVTLMNP